MRVPAVLACIVAGLSLPATALGLAPDRPVTFKIPLNVNGKSGSVHGTAAVRVPASFGKDNLVGGTYVRRYKVTDSSGCVGHTSISVRSIATSMSSRAQIERTLLPNNRLAELGRGTRPHGSCGLNFEKFGDPGSLYGIAPVHLSGKLWAQLRVLSNFDDGTCSDAAIRDGVLAAATKRILRTGTVSARYSSERP